MHLIIYGPEGSGKGTQAKLLSEKLGLPVYTSGDLVREAAEKDKGLIGDACRRALSEGIYVPDSEMFVLWKNKLRSTAAKKGFILDGFPRNVRQATFLLRKIEKYGYGIDRFIFITLSDSEAHKRLSKRNRKLFPGSSEMHDTPDRIDMRLSAYRKEERGLVDFFRDKKILLEINGEQPVERVFADIISGLEAK